MLKFYTVYLFGSVAGYAYISGMTLLMNSLVAYITQQKFTVFK